VDYASERQVEFFDLLWIDHQRSGAGDFGQSGAIGGDHRKASRHGLENRQPETFLEGGKNQRGGRAVKLCQEALVDVTEDSDAMPGGAGLDPFQDKLGPVAKRTCKHKQALGVHAFEGFYEPANVLADLEGAYVQQDRRFQRMPATKLLQFRSRKLRNRIHSVMDDGDLGSWITQMPDDLVGSVVGNRDDVVRALSGIAGQGREALAKFRRRVIAGKHEQIVEGGNTAPPLAPR